jgi:hypothetical protein
VKEAGGRRQEAGGKRKKEGARRSVFTNMRCSSRGRREEAGGRRSFLSRGFDFSCLRS